MISRQSAIALAIGTTMFGTAQAGFVVNDDAPVVTATHPEAARKERTVYVSFSGIRIQGPSRTDLEALTDGMPAPDAAIITATVRSAKQLPAANRRVAAVRLVLLRKGISPDRIDSNADVDPQADALDTDVKVKFRSSTQRPSADSIRSGRLAQPSPVQPAQQIAPSAQPYAYTASAPGMPIASGGSVPATSLQGQNLAKLEFVKKIMAMASSKLITQESAVKLVNEYLANTATAPSQAGPAAASTEGPAIVPSAPQIVPFGEVPRVWTLNANRSLRDNVRDWALAAGYGEPAWMASNAYQVTYTSTYTGTFVEVLNQLANSIPAIDFRLSRNTRRLEVVDHL